ncbi:DMT family transporter [Pseudonocardia phyllosphaerae]|uniref:DMT family transporter n=1 Tax=Pseudonocardia phyllosphaerae TaxID=3390502 RepID=UPI00397B344E
MSAPTRLDPTVSASTPTATADHAPSSTARAGFDLQSAGSLLMGAAVLSWTGILVALADTGAATASFWRCALALVVLVPWAVAEYRRHGAVSLRYVGRALLSGLFLGADFLLWTRAVLESGAGIANVVLNVQVVALPLIAWAVAREKIAPRLLLAAPLLLGGIALAGGALGAGVSGPDPVHGALLGTLAGVAYSGFLYLNRTAAQQQPRHMVTPVMLATVAAGVVSGVAGLLTGGIEVSLPAHSWAWLIVLALTGQVVSWLLIGRGSAGLPSGTASALLLAHPVLSVVFGMIVLGEQLNVWQVLGCVVVVGTVAWVARPPRAARASRDQSSMRSEPV